MGFKDFMYSEKGKITGSVLAAVLISAAILVPVSIFTDRAINKSDGYKHINTWGYDEQVSSTAEKINAYMNIDKQYTANIYGGDDVESGEPTLLLNSNYHTVEDDSDILDGVYGADGAIGYLSSSWITGYKDNPFKMLSTYAPGTGTYISPILEDGSFNNEYIEQLPTLNATLNIHLKVKSDVADWIRPNIIAMAGGTNSEIVTDDIPEKFKGFLIEEDLVDDFLVSLGFFEFIAFDKENITNINTSVLPGTNAEGTIDFGEENLNILNTAYKEIIEDSEASLLEAVIAQQKSTSDLYDIAIDGTGTNTGLMNTEFINFEKRINELTGSQINFNYKFVNGGSGEGFKLPSDDYYGGETGSDAQANAFLGTQSRAAHDTEVEAWGYSTTIPADSDGKYNSLESSVDNQIIGYTMGIDLISFFVKDNFSFQYTISTNDQLIALGEDMDTTEYKVGQRVNIKPIGITDYGLKLIYQTGKSWTDIMDAGLMIGEIV